MTLFARAFRGAALACAALAATFGAFAATSSPARAEPAIWRVSDADSTVWIFGSVHALPPDLEWRRSELDVAMAEAEVVYFEISLDPQTEAALQMRVLELGFNAPGVRLSDSLSPEGRQRFERVLSGLGATITPFERLKPWLAVVALDALIMESEGSVPEAGVDALLEQEARAAGREIRSLETMEQALGFFADLPDADQIMLLEQSLILYEQHPDFGKELEAAWVSGDLETLETLLLGALAQMPPSVYETVVRNRNLDWAEQLDGFMSEGDATALVVVGAGHMLGDDSLTLMLEERGYTVERR